MRGRVGGSTDLSDTSVSGHDDDGGLIALKRPVEEREALDVQHVNLIDEEYTWHDLCTALFSPLGNLPVDLFSHLGLDLTDVTREESHEALRARVDHINLVQCDRVYNLLALLELSLRALDEPSLRANVVVIAAARERPTKLRDLSAGLVDGDDITCNDLLLGDSFDHLGTQVIDSLHLSRLKRDLSCLGPACDSLVDLNLDDLTLNDLRLFSDSHS